MFDSSDPILRLCLTCHREGHLRRVRSAHSNDSSPPAYLVLGHIHHSLRANLYALQLPLTAVV